MDGDKFSLSISVHFNTKIGCLMESPNHNCTTLTVPMLAFQSWMGRKSAYDLYTSTPRLGVLESQTITAAP
eukprot:scaffold55110_cov47-Cyclotella_meneghiniana.AAC.1